MRRLARTLIAALLTLEAWSAGNLKLYLKDGSDHLVREYQVLDDRVRFFSVERSGWEELPLELIDLDRTRRDAKRIEDDRATRSEEDRIERKAEREFRTELHRVPLEDGVYCLNGEQVTALKQAEPKVKGNKRRSVLKAISPIPIVSGKATLEIEGVESLFVVHQASPQFYMRLDKLERFGIIRLTPKKDSRIVEELTIVPISKEIVETQKEVEVFRQQLAPGVYRIWPVEPLEPGQYAVVQFRQEQFDQKELNIQVWDFAYRK